MHLRFDPRHAMNDFASNCRFAIRMIRKHPGSSALAIVALTLGIGLVSSMYSLLHGIVLAGLPFPNSERLVQIERTNPLREDFWNGIVYGDFEILRHEAKSFESLASSTTGTMNVAEAGMLPMRYDGAWISANFTAQLDVAPILGRAFTPEDDRPGAAPVALISDRLWNVRYERDPAVVGRVIRVNGEDTTIVGVLPAGFQFPNNEQMWIPIHRNPRFVGPDWGAQVFGTLTPGVSLGQAQAELDALFPSLLSTSTDPNKEPPLRVRSLHAAFLGIDLPKQLLTMMGSVVFVLLIACANVANLQLARAITRTRELAIRNSVGATRGHLVRQLLIESVVIAGAGAIGGIALSRFAVSWYQSSLAVQTPPPPYWWDFSFNWPVATFTAIIAVLAGVLSGLAPAWKATRPDIQEMLKESGRGSSSGHAGRFARSLVVVQVALTCALLIGSGLMIKTIVMMGSEKLPYDPDRVFGARVGLFAADYEDAASRHRFFDDLVRRVGSLSGVETAAVSNRLLHFPSYGAPYEEFGHTYVETDERPSSRWEAVSASYFDTLGVPILEGRAFTEADARNAEIAIVNSTFAKRTWPGESAIGRRFRPDFQSSEVENRWLTVVGVVPDLRMTGFQDIGEDGRGFYVPFHTQVDRFMTILARTSGDPMSYLEPVRREVQALDGNLPIYFPDTMSGYIENAMVNRKLVANLFLIFGAVAVVLAGIGIYGVMAASVNHRVREIGVRMALGAHARDIVRMILGQGAWQLAGGVVVGLASATGLSRLMATLLYNVEARDVQVFLLVPMFLAGVALMACLLPARRAAQVAPLEALRAE